MKLALLLIKLLILASSLTNNRDAQLQESNKGNHNHHLKTDSIDAPQQHQLFNGSEHDQHQANYQHSKECSYTQTFAIDTALKQCQDQNLTDTKRCLYTKLNYQFDVLLSFSKWNFIGRQKNGKYEYLYPYDCSYTRQSYGRYSRYFYFWKTKKLQHMCFIPGKEIFREKISFCRKNEIEKQAKCISELIKASYDEKWNVVITTYQIITHWFSADQKKQHSILSYNYLDFSKCYFQELYQQSGIKMTYTVWYAE